MSAEDRLEHLRFDVARSLRYHDKRRGFFETLGKALQLVALLGSSAAVLALVNKSGSDLLPVVFAASAAGASLLNLVIGTDGQIRKLHQAKKSIYRPRSQNPINSDTDG
jgi:hypothetical protein